jgi:hypothetical protein
VNRVTSVRGASAPGRRPRRTKRIGAGAAETISWRTAQALLAPAVREPDDRRDGQAHGPEDVSEAQLFADLAVSAL